MAESVLDKIPPGPKLDTLTAEKVFGWKNVHTSMKVRLSVGSRIGPGAGA